MDKSGNGSGKFEIGVRISRHAYSWNIPQHPCGNELQWYRRNEGDYPEAAVSCDGHF
jgi:hypothetical protein